MSDLGHVDCMRKPAFYLKPAALHGQFTVSLSLRPTIQYPSLYLGSPLTGIAGIPLFFILARWSVPLELATLSFLRHEAVTNRNRVFVWPCTIENFSSRPALAVVFPS